MPESKECAHPGCHCQVAADQTYCCPACEKAAKEGSDASCDCDHKGCQQ